MKYTKLLTAISDSDRVYTTNGGIGARISSIYEENPQDPKIDIPQNKFLFNNIIKESFDVNDSSDDEEEKLSFMSQ